MVAWNGFLYKVDLLFTDPATVDFITAFKSNNDFGALLGHMLCTAGQYYELVNFGCATRPSAACICLIKTQNGALRALPPAIAPPAPPPPYVQYIASQIFTINERRKIFG